MHTNVEVDIWFINAVKKLVTDVREFLRSTDGNDADFIQTLHGLSYDVMQRAKEIPSLHEWARDLAAADMEERVNTLAEMCAAMEEQEREWLTESVRLHKVEQEYLRLMTDEQQEHIAA